MNDKFNQFVANIQNQYAEVGDKTNIYQCFDLAYLWIFCLGIPKASISHLYAYQIYTQPTALTRQYFDLIPNTPTGVPQAGDLVVWNTGFGGIAGHVAVCSSDADVNRFKSLDQNFPVGSNCHLQEHNYTGVVGWLRPKLQAPTTPINDQTIIDLGSYGKLEVQAIKGKLGDLVRVSSELSGLQTKHDKLVSAVKSLPV